MRALFTVVVTLLLSVVIGASLPNAVTNNLSSNVQGNKNSVLNYFKNTFRASVARRSLDNGKSKDLSALDRLMQNEKLKAHVPGSIAAAPSSASYSASHSVSASHSASHSASVPLFSNRLRVFAYKQQGNYVYQLAAESKSVYVYEIPNLSSSSIPAYQYFIPSSSVPATTSTVEYPISKMVISNDDFYFSQTDSYPVPDLTNTDDFSLSIRQ